MKFVVYLGRVTDPLSVKTALGVHEWTNNIVAQIVEPGSYSLPNIPVVNSVSDVECDALLIGATTADGKISESWHDVCADAVGTGKLIYCGMHERLSDHIKRWFPSYDLSRIFDFRHQDIYWNKDNGSKRAGKRVLTVANDCSCGKKYNAIAMAKIMTERGYDAEFVATGQTGKLISGQGIAIDTVPVDFVSGAIAHMSPSAEGVWYFIEGQGAITHPSYSGNTASVLTGAQPDFLVYSYDPTREKARGSAIKIADIYHDLDLSLRMARITNPRCDLAGIVLHDQNLSEMDALRHMDELSTVFKVPVVRRTNYSMNSIVNYILEKSSEQTS